VISYLKLQPNLHISSTICTKAYEIAENSLKAGMLAKCGLGEASFNCPDLEIIASILIQFGFPSKLNNHANVLM